MIVKSLSLAAFHLLYNLAKSLQRLSELHDFQVEIDVAVVKEEDCFYLFVEVVNDEIGYLHVDLFYCFIEFKFSILTFSTQPVLVDKVDDAFKDWTD